MLLGEVEGGGEAVAAGADDDDVVFRLGLGIAPLRLPALVPAERINIRLDYGRSGDDDGIYFSVLEAFLAGRERAARSGSGERKRGAGAGAEARSGSERAAGDPAPRSVRSPSAASAVARVRRPRAGRRRAIADVAGRVPARSSRAPIGLTVLAGGPALGS